MSAHSQLEVRVAALMSFVLAAYDEQRTFGVSDEHARRRVSGLLAARTSDTIAMSRAAIDAALKLRRNTPTQEIFS